MTTATSTDLVSYNLKLMKNGDDAFNSRDVAGMNATHHPEMIAHVTGSAEPIRGRVAHAAMIQQMLRIFPDVHVDNDPYLIQFGSNDWITVITRTRGTFTGEMILPDGNVIAPTGKAFDLNSATTARWEGDLLREEYVFWDSALQAHAGTGKLSQALVAAGHRVTAVEPLAEMRAILDDRVPEARALDGMAEETGLPDACADAVVAGSAFHWFDRARALAEITRILRAPGVVGLLGNGFDPSVQWVARLREILGGSRLGRPGHWLSDEELLEYFDSVQEREFPHEQIVDRDRFRDLALSRCSIATLEAVEQEALLKRVDALWVHEPELQGRDRARLGYLTRVRRCSGLH